MKFFATTPRRKDQPGETSLLSAPAEQPSTTAAGSAASTTAQAATFTPGTGSPTGSEAPPGDLRGLFAAATDAPALCQAFTALAHRHQQRRVRYLGFPVAYDLEFPLTRTLLAAGFFNNISTTKYWPPGFQHAMEPEERVLDWLSDLIGLPADHRWGHLTTGGTAGNRTGIRVARELYPDAVLIHSAAAHYSVPRAGQDLRLATYEVRSTEQGQMDLADLDVALGVITRGKPSGSVPVIMVATYGTTMTEASDDLRGIHTVLDGHGIVDRYLHLDAALAGIPLALDGAADFSSADSVSVSGYKFLAVPDACGIIVGRGAPDGLHIPYTDTLDATETGVRSGLHAALLLESIVTLGDDGHRARAHASRDLADYVIARLRAAGWNAGRNPDAYFTVVFNTPGPDILEKWTMSTHPSGVSHVLTIPGHTREVFDSFLDDMATGRPPRTNPFPSLTATPM